MVRPDNITSEAQTRLLQHPPGSAQTRILLVDDDYILRTVIQLGLEKLGYAVSSADGGETALEAAAQNKDIKLLLTDVLMPEMNGVELAEKLRETHPRLEVLYVSGHPLETLSTLAVPGDPIHFLQKPFGSAQLDDRIRTILSKRPGL
jgi:DNA-binding NtrC family response regulator